MKNLISTIVNSFLFASLIFGQHNVIECFHETQPIVNSSVINTDKIESIRTDKIAYNKDGGSFKVFFEVNDPNITSVYIFDNQNRINRKGLTGWFQLNDNQNNGDEIANDLVFSIDSLRISNLGLWALVLSLIHI